MSSATSQSGEPAQSGEIQLVDDRSTKARIRDAAIASFAEHGIAGTTVRKIGAAAGVSPGLVIHHFGSMDGLRLACDEHVALTIRHVKEESLSQGPGIDVLAAIRDSDVGSLSGYLAKVLVDDSPTVARLVDELVDDAEEYMQRGVDTGMLLPHRQLRGRAVVVAVWSLGALVLHEHLERLLGVDITDPAVAVDPAFASYLGPAYEIMAEGLFTEAFASSLQGLIAAGSDPHPETPKGNP